MVRKARNGIVYPYKVTRKKRLKDGTTTTYVSYEFKIDNKTYSRKKYTDANALLTRLLQERQTFGTAGGNTAITLGAYAQHWLELRHRDADPKTFANYRTIVNKHLRPYHSQKLANLNASICDRIVNGLTVSKTVNGRRQHAKASLSLRRQMHTTLNQICKAAVADRLLPTNPMGGVPNPKDKDISLIDPRKTGTHERTAFTVDEARRILQTATELGVRDGVKEWFRLCTGMRPGEILGASLQDLELAEQNGIPYGEYTVNWKLEELKKEHGCGKPDRKGVYPCGYKRGAACPRWRWRIPDGFDMIELEGRWCLTPPKSKRGRKVPIVPALAQALELYLRETDDIPNPHGLLFRHDDGSPIEPEEDMRQFRSLLEQAGIPDAEYRSRHETRHTTVTILMSMGVDYGLVEEIVGHSSRAMVEHYRHAGLRERLAAMEKMNQPLQLDATQWKGC